VKAEFAKKALKYASDNSPTILTSIGTVGVITTAVLAAGGAYKASRIILEEQAYLDKTPTPATMNGHPAHQLTKKEKAQLTWMYYLPAVGSAALTCGAIIGANRIADSRTAAMAAAFTMSEKALVEYKDKVVETFGKTKGDRVQDAVMQDRVAQSPVPQGLVVMTGQKQLCYDAWTDRYFHSTMEDLKKAQNDLNHRILSDNYASLSDFYSLIGLPPTQGSDDIGWNVDKLLEINFTTCISPDQIPAIAMDYRVEPIRGFHRVR
jgi:hypothetical protein